MDKDKMSIHLTRKVDILLTSILLTVVLKGGKPVCFMRVPDTY